MSQSNPVGHFSWVVQCCLMSQSITSKLYGMWTRVVQGFSLSFTVNGLELWGWRITSLVVQSSDRSCMVFGPDFPYKVDQLSSSNKNSGKCKILRSVKKCLYSLQFHIRSHLGQRHGHQSTTLTSLFYENLYWKVNMYILMKVIFKTNLFIRFSHFQTQQLKSYSWFIIVDGEFPST
jgi:hypothetical protein